MTDIPNLRTFIGIPVPDEVQQALDHWLHRRAQCRTTPNTGERPITAGNRHVTLHFLGNLTAVERRTLSEKLDGLVAQQRCFHLRFSTLQQFPDAKSPIVAATCDSSDALIRLWQSCSEALRLSQLSHLISKRALRPHITLIRHNARHPAVEQSEVWELPVIDFPVTQVCLYDSQLHSNGSHYQPLRTINLRQ